MRGFLAHEILHVLGIHHTQKRKDRDEHIEVQLNNIDNNPSARYQYSKCEDCDMYGTKYDCMSVMHYRDSTFGTVPTMIAKDPSKCDLKGNNDYLTPNDIDLINKMYKCLTASKACPTKFGHYICGGASIGKTDSAYECARKCQISSSCKSWDYGIRNQDCWHDSQKADCFVKNPGYMAATKCLKRN